MLSNSRWALKLAASHSPGLVATRAAIVVLNGIVPAAFVYGAKEIIDALRASGSISEAMPWIAIVPVLSVVTVLLRPVAVFINARLADELNLALNMLILEHAATLELAFFEDPEHQDMLARVQRNSAQQIQMLVDNTAGLVRNLMQIATLTLVVVFIEPLAVALLAVLAVPYFVFQLRLSRLQYWIDHNREAKRRWTRYFASTLMSHRSVPEVKLLDLAPLLVNRCRAVMSEIRDQNRTIYRRRAIGALVFGLLGTVVIYQMMFRLVRRAVSGAATVGSVAAYLLAIERLAVAVTGLVELIARSVRSTLTVADLRAFLSEESPAVEDGDQRPALVRGAVEFRDVSFRYPGSERSVLRGVSFAIRPGEVVALVGPNGAGKSTLVKLLGKLYAPDEGAILFDGQDLRCISDIRLRSRISFVLQRFGRYEASARENIAYGDWKRLIEAPEEVHRIAERAGVAEMIEALPDGFDTLLGRTFGKVTLSGGQWQALALARSFARESVCLVLDEPTSNLDARRELELYSRIRELSRGRSVLLVSHRFSTVSMADRIVVLDEGRVVEDGAHEELVDAGGIYAELYAIHRRLVEDAGPASITEMETEGRKGHHGY